ncbi:hypothetical protein AB0E88_25020 [Streptomyces sp. NPDC028635]|uniref:hypothetical protein n=1 Tax=Streptomyces sp. NPDC028635 TaxID=3154800 RepID=UPI0033DFE5A5
MSFSAGFGGSYASYPASRVRMPRALVTARVLLFALFGFTVLGALGVLMVLHVTGQIAGLLVYAAAPGVAGLVLARRAWTGGRYVRWSLIGVQALLVLQATASIGRGDPRGLAQITVPIAVIVLLSLRPVREWFLLPELEREENPGFSLARMLKWRHSDEGQSTLEYVGMVTLVVAIVVALLLTGVGGQLADGFRSAVCSVTGSGCAAPGGGDGPVKADGGKGDSAGTTQGDGTTQGGGVSGGATDSGGGSNGGSAGSGGQADGGSSDSGGASGGGSGGTAANASDATSKSSEGDGDGGGKSTLDQVGDLFTSPFKAAWGDVKDTAHMIRHPVDSAKQMWNGLSTYTGDWWSAKSDELGGRWDKGGWNYLGVPLEWVASPAEFSADFLVDSFVDVDSFKKGNWGDGFGNTVWNIGSMFIPGVGEVKWLNRLNKLNKLTKAVKVTERVAKAVEDAKKAAKAGDVKGAEKAAKEADEAADEAEKRARESGCTIAAPSSETPYEGGGSRLGGGPGTGTAVLAAGRPEPYVVLAEGKCDEDAKQQAQDARQKADEAERQTLEARAERAKAALRERGSSVPDDQIDGLVARAKDNPDPAKTEIGTKEAADALDEIADLAGRKNVNGDAAAALEGKVVNASDANKLAEARAEVNAVRRAADEAAPGTQVDAGVGQSMNRKEADLGNGEKVNLDEIPDADVVYKDRNGTVQVKEVKNAGSATRKADFANQVERLKKWASKEPGRKATVEIETMDRWTSIFSEFKPARNGKPAKDTRTAAGEMAKNGVDAKVAGQHLSADQLDRMQRAINERTANGTMDWAKMKDPKSAKAYLGID